MPLYEYRCLKCGYRFEKLQKTGEGEEPTCILCGSPEVEKSVSPFSPTGSSSEECHSGGG